MKQCLAISLGIMLLAGCASTAPQAGPAEPKPPARGDGTKPYSEVITKDAKTDSGLFHVHRVKQKWYFEIPNREFGKEFLFVTSQARTQSGVGYGGDNLNTQVVKWERNGERILLRSVYYSAVAADTLPVAYAVRKATLPPILMAFDIQAFNKDSSALVVDVTDFFTSDVAELGLDRFQRDQYKVRRLDGKRSFIEKIRSFPDNIEIEATLTYDAGQVPEDRSLSTLSMVVHHSMVRLPENPMMPRLADERVGFFGVTRTDYGYDAQRAEQRRYITRWRLEPKDMDALRRGELVAIVGGSSRSPRNHGEQTLKPKRSMKGEQVSKKAQTASPSQVASAVIFSSESKTRSKRAQGMGAPRGCAEWGKGCSASLQQFRAQRETNN